jgi:hypothetical protein
VRAYTPLMAGLLTRGSQLPRTFPDMVSSGSFRGRSPLTVAGAVTDLAPFGYTAPCSLFISSALGVREPSRAQNPFRLCGSIMNPSCERQRLRDWGQHEGSALRAFRRRPASGGSWPKRSLNGFQSWRSAPTFGCSHHRDHQGPYIYYVISQHFFAGLQRPC